MSGYHGRTGPNFSHYINSLNTIPQPYEQDFLPTDDLNLDQELALFTNTDFTDFDNLGSLSDNALTYGLDKNAKPSNHDPKYEDLLANATTSPNNPEPVNVPYYPDYPPAIPPTLASPTYAQDARRSSPTSPSSDAQVALSKPVDTNRKAEVTTATSPQQAPGDQQSRLAAEEDKRRRNTAASARFRVKKKQREQALERTVKEVNDHNSTLEVKISQLEMENRWLKNLITERNGKHTEEEIADAYQKFRRESEDRETNRNVEHKKGVGTTS